MTESILSPAEIKILLHYYAIPGPYKGPKNLHFNLQDLGLLAGIGLEEVTYKITEKGKAHVNQLCNLSLPIQGWIGAKGEILP